MIYKLGVVGHPHRIGIVSAAAKENFNNIEIYPVNYQPSDNLTTAYENFDYIRNHVDGVLFTDEKTYTIFKQDMVDKIPWNYIKPSPQLLLSALFKAKLHLNYDIMNISLDSYTHKTVRNIYQSVHIDTDQLNLALNKQDIHKVDYIEKTIAFHKNCFLENESLCITSHTLVHQTLNNMNIKNLLIEPDYSLIASHIQGLFLLHKANQNEANQLVLMSIRIDKSSEYALMRENQYQFFVEKNKVIEEILKFTDKLKATMIDIGEREFLLVLTKFNFETETKGLTILNILHKINEDTKFTISAGIGYGQTGIEAKRHAELGLKNAQSQGGNRAFVVLNQKTIIGPIIPTKDIDQSDDLFDSKLKEIADHSSLSINTIYKIHCAVQQKGDKLFTPIELAELFAITPRTMNRIIEKLLVNNYVEVVGRKVVSTAGRPSRIIKVLF